MFDSGLRNSAARRRQRGTQDYDRHDGLDGRNGVDWHSAGRRARACDRSAHQIPDEVSVATRSQSTSWCPRGVIMELVLIVARIRTGALLPAEKKVHELGVRGITVIK